MVSFILLFSGHFKQYLMIMGITLFHEMGHIIMAKILKWDIKEMVILPFGCITHFQTELNVQLKEEFLVAVAGPISQMIGATIYYYFTKDGLFWFYHQTLLILNLIPIIPLDGSKILQVFLHKFFPYKKTLFISLKISYLFLLGVFILQVVNFNFLILLWAILLLLENKKEKEIQPLKFYLFLKERYQNHYKFPYRYLNCEDVRMIQKEYQTIFMNKYTEKEVIKRYFIKKKIRLMLGDLFDIL